MGFERKSRFYNVAYRSTPEYALPPDGSRYYPVWCEILDRIDVTDGIMDFGCGTGQLAELAVSRGYEYYLGIDFSSEAISMARSRDLPGDKFRIADLNKASTYRGLEYDVAVMCEVVEHIQNDFTLLGNIPIGKRVIITLPPFDSAGHVRFFKSPRSIRKRYGYVIDINNIKKVKAGNTFLFIVDGYVKEHDISVIRSAVSRILIPQTNEHYERDSIDGYAFLAWAMILLGMDTANIDEILSKKCYGLNAEHSIRGVDLPRDAVYTYSCWPAFEVYHMQDDHTRIDEIISHLNRIGTYPNGMMKYCDTEIDYTVPNVTSVSALMYAENNDMDRALELIHTLEQHQTPKGNWTYGDGGRNEDSPHLAMMVYCLRRVGDIYPGIGPIIRKSLLCLYKMNRNGLKAGKLGFGPPLLLVAIAGMNKELEVKAYNRTIELLHHANFRVRAISAWALATYVTGVWKKS